MINERAVSGWTGWYCGFESLRSADEGVGDVDAHGGGFDITLDTGELSGDEEVGSGAEFEPGMKGFGGFDVGVAVDDAHSDKLRVFESGHHSEDFELGSPLHPGLTGDQRVESLFTVFGSKLESGPGAALGARIAKANGLEISESK